MRNPIISEPNADVGGFLRLDYSTNTRWRHLDPKTTYKKLHSHTKYLLLILQIPGGPVISYYDLDGQYLRYDVFSQTCLFIKTSSLQKVCLDFNLIPGYSVPGLDYFYIDSIETVSLFGLPARKFSLIPDSGMSLVSPAYILEGIGSSIGLVDLILHSSTSSPTDTALFAFSWGMMFILPVRVVMYLLGLWIVIFTSLSLDYFQIR